MLPCALDESSLGSGRVKATLGNVQCFSNSYNDAMNSYSILAQRYIKSNVFFFLFSTIIP